MIDMSTSHSLTTPLAHNSTHPMPVVREDVFGDNVLVLERPGESDELGVDRDIEGSPMTGIFFGLAFSTPLWVTVWVVMQRLF
jgi:hypothetical protein